MRFKLEEKSLYNSKKMKIPTHPMDQTSHGCDQPNSKITSGAL